MMSEICMKGRILFSKAKASRDIESVKEARVAMEALESEMVSCVVELERLMSKYDMRFMKF